MVSGFLLSCVGDESNWEDMHTDLDAVEAEEEARENHLSEAETRPEHGEEADGSDAEEVDKEDGEETVDEAEFKHRHADGPDGEGGDDHVCC